MKKNDLKKRFTRALKPVSGFTLIELLVVVAIIGVLASVVLVAINNARGKGGDSVVKSNLANIRAQAELIYSASGCYGDGTPVTDTNCAGFPEAPCPALITATTDSLFKNATVNGQIMAAIAAGGANGGVCSSETGGAQWGVAVALKVNPADSWCVDSSGASKLVPATTPTNSLTASKCN